MAQITEYFQVILPVRLDWEPWYSCLADETDPIRIGERVKVVFSGRTYIAVVASKCKAATISEEKIHPIESRERALEVISGDELKFWRFVSEYYLCSIGEVYKTAYPSVRIDSELKRARKPKKTSVRPRAGISLTLEMQDAVEAIAVAHAERKAALLECSDSAQRDEITGNFIQTNLQRGKDVLYLVAETLRCTELESRLLPVYGDRLLKYSSSVTPPRRRDIATLCRSNTEGHLIIGTRMSLFLPFSNLGLVIVEDEESSLYKNGSSPRFNARDAVLMLASIHSSDVILMSPTPSLETLYNCRTGLYRRVKMTCPSAHVTIIASDAERRKRGMNGDLSFKAEALMKNALEKRLTVNVITGFDAGGRSRKQISAKYGLTVITKAEFLLGKDSFRADERALQTLRRLQFACSELVIQTSNQSHPLFVALSENSEDAVEMYCESLMKERSDFKLPPYYRMVEIRVRDNNLKRLAKLECALKEEFDGNLDIALPRNSSLQSSKLALMQKVTGFEKKFRYPGHIIVDVDPD